jgi:xylan 1,4-beta-xylosidase
MSGKRVAVNGNMAYDFRMVRDSSVRGIQTDVNALATKDERSAAIMVWNYHDDDLPGQAAPISLQVSGLPAGRVMIHHYRIDQNHSNSYTDWKKMGSPQYPGSRQYAELEKAGQLELLETPEWTDTMDGKILIDMKLPRQGVSLIRFSW